jgi:methyl-accepting chemotaxis protein
MDTTLNLVATLFSITPPNIVFTAIIFALLIMDIVLKKDLKGQIVSVGVLGTFVGIFIGLQNFDPESMKNSVHSILLGLKTAFATSILGMSVAIFLAIYQKIVDSDSPESKSEGELLSEISRKLENLNYLPRIDNSTVVNKLDEVIEALPKEQNSADEQILKALLEIKNKQVTYGSDLQTLLRENFKELNSSMEEATKQLSKGATEEIVDALQQVIKNFNENLQDQFGENFKELNSAVVNLVDWQDKYKNHIEDLENRLDLSTSSIEKAQSSLEAISSNNENIMEVYNSLSDIINTYKSQTDNLTENLQSYSNLGPKAEELFSNMNREFTDMSESFKELSLTIVDGNRIQKDSFVEMNKKIISLINENGADITETFRTSLDSVTESFKMAYESLERQRYEINIIANHFRVMGEQIPNSLRVSLEELNSALASITAKFQKDYQDVMYRYKETISQQQQQQHYREV